MTVTGHVLALHPIISEPNLKKESVHLESPRAQTEAVLGSHQMMSNGTIELPDQLAIGYASASVGDKTNEDCFGVVTPHEIPDAVQRGTAIAVADGGSAGGTGRIAAELTVRTLLQDFYATPSAWSVERAIDTVLCSVNDWLYVQNGRDPDLDGVVSTVSMLLFRDGIFHLAHVGDTRVYRWQAGTFDRLTLDHTWPRRDMRHVLRRAVGLDNHLVIDFLSGNARAGDVFLVASDGVWEVLGNDVLGHVLGGSDSVEEMATSLVAQSVRSQRRYMGHNDATALVVRVLGAR